MAARKFSNLHTATTLSGSINAAVTTLPLTSLAGLPVTYPYNLVLENGTAQIEVVSVTAAGGGLNLTVTRGQDGTTAQTHNAGASVVHGIVAQDVQEPQDHMAASTNVHGLSGGAAVVGTTQAQTLTNKTISGASNTLSAIPDSALVAIAASKVTQPFATLAASGNTTVGGTLGVTGATTLAAVAATSAAISGNATVGGTLGVTGATTLAAVSATSAAVSGNETVGGTLGVTGTTTLGVANTGNLGVTGTLGVSGAATLAGVAASGNVTVGGTLGITGATTAAAVTGTTLTGSTDVVRGSKSLPRGILGGKRYQSGGTLASTTAEALAGMDTGSLTLEAGRKYRIFVHYRVTVSANDTYVTARVRDTNLAGAILTTHSHEVHGFGAAYDYHFSDIFNSPGAGAKTYAVTIQGTGSLTLTAGSATIPTGVWIEDIGPSSPDVITVV